MQAPTQFTHTHTYKLIYAHANNMAVGDSNSSGQSHMISQFLLQGERDASLIQYAYLQLFTLCWQADIKL